jgi:hypothetical protein
MMKKSLFLAMLLLSSICFANETWQQHLENGYLFFSNLDFENASLDFDQAINLMSEDEHEQFPYVLVARAENNYFLKNYAKVLEDTEKALESKYLTDFERLICGIHRIAVFMQRSDEDFAVEEYKKYIIGCPLFPKYDRFEEKIVIRNVPDCNCYKNCAKQLLMSKHCTQEKDIREYGNTWIIDITKNYDSLKETKNAITHRRSPEEVQACCNTCNRLSTAANFICNCLPIPPQLGGSITKNACRISCPMYVEMLREDCEACCNDEEGKCWGTFESWKKQFKKENHNCPHPTKECPK